MRRRSSRMRLPTGTLWRRFRKTRSAELRNHLLEAYLPIVTMVAARVAHRLPAHVDPDDLESVGVFGLFNAIDNYDPDRGVKFETYCRKRIAGAMLDELRRQDWIPREARDRVDLLCEARTRLKEKHRREPSDLELAREMKVTLRAVHDISLELVLTGMIPLDTEDDDGERAGHRFHPVDGFPEPSEAVSRSELLSLVDRHLSSSERVLVRGYYHDEHTLKRIGTSLRLSESRVSQMHHHMLTRLKERLYSEVAP